MNRAVAKLFSSHSNRYLSRIFASNQAGSTKATTTTGHHDHHHDDHHDHHHHHEPELRKTQTWRHQSGVNSKYENQGEDPNIQFVQERPNYHDYRPGLGQIALTIPYRSQAHIYEMWLYHVAMFISIWLWWYVFWRLLKEPYWLTGHAHYPDMSKFTDEELGIPPDDFD